MISIEAVPAETMREGEGARVNRLFPTGRVRHHDPFVLLDEFFVQPGTGFPSHRHRGFEAVTYMLEGTFRHEDDAGNDMQVPPGGVQRFTAGRGIEHSEMPGTGEPIHGLQLWVNLPRSLKKSEPSYQLIQPEELPEKETDEGARVRIVAGADSPLTLHTPVVYLDVTLPATTGWEPPVLDGKRGLVYVFEGTAVLGDHLLSQGEGFFFEQVGNERLTRVSAPGKGRARLVLIAGDPIGEPIRQRGPYVD
jgi:hypothetical protein